MVEKTIHLTGTSTNSIEDAVGLAVTRAAATIDGIRQAEIAGVTAVVDDQQLQPFRGQPVHGVHANEPGAAGDEDSLWLHRFRHR